MKYYEFILTQVTINIEKINAAKVIQISIDQLELIRNFFNIKDDQAWILPTCISPGKK